MIALKEDEFTTLLAARVLVDNGERIAEFVPHGSPPIRLRPGVTFCLAVKVTDVGISLVAVEEPAR